MSNFFELLEKYKFGLLAALLAYVIIFAYFQIGTYNGGGAPYSPFHEGARIEIPEDEIQLLPENIMMPSNYDVSNIKNTARDVNDKRTRSEKDYSVSKQTSSGPMDAKAYEEKLFQEAGGEAERQKIREQMAAQKARANQQAKTNADPDKSATSGTANAAAGSTMVDFSVPGHTAFQGNDYYVRNPGYRCGFGASGTVIITVKVDQSGKVISANYDASRSRNANSCMIAEAKKYALISKFNYSATAPNSQEGWISYTFISQ